MRLANKKIVITAAGQGIGRATALACAQEGARVFATDINSESLAALKTHNSNIETALLNVTDRGAIQRFASATGPIDVLFNCAGFVDHGTILDCEPDAWERSFQINVTAMYDMIRAVLPGMLERQRGNIINMSSVASSIKGVPARCVYATTKAAVLGLTKSVAADFVAQGIRCNAICPGTVDTPSLDTRLRAHADYDQARAAFVARQPMGRLGTPDEIAHLVVYLASDESSYTTGAIHVIDGGWDI